MIFTSKQLSSTGLDLSQGLKIGLECAGRPFGGLPTCAQGPARPRVGVPTCLTVSQSVAVCRFDTGQIPPDLCQLCQWCASCATQPSHSVSQICLTTVSQCLTLQRLGRPCLGWRLSFSVHAGQRRSRALLLRSAGQAVSRIMRSGARGDSAALRASPEGVR